MVRIQRFFFPIQNNQPIHCNVMTQFLCHIWNWNSFFFFGVIHDNIDICLEPQPIYALYILLQYIQLENGVPNFHTNIGERKKFDEFKNKIILRMKQVGKRKKLNT